MASPAIDFARNNQQRFLNELKDLLRIPSVSTLDEHKTDVQKAADFVANDLRRIGDVECPVFYLNYNLNPQAVPWKDSISHAIRTFKGTEYTISRPRDLWFSTTEMVGRILRHKRDKDLPSAAGGKLVIAAVNSDSLGVFRLK